MTALGLAFRQDFAAPASDRVAPPAVDLLRALLLDQQRDDGHWTDEWASSPAAVGPVGVTAAAVVALLDSGLSPDAPTVSRAIDWLWGRTVAPAAKDPDPPEAESLAALTAFLRSGRIAPGTSPIVTEAVRAVREIQNDDGGWTMASADRPANDDSRADTTGEVLTVLGLNGITVADPIAWAAVAFLERDQEPDSGWGSLSATAAVLAGFRAVGMDARGLPERRAAEWIKRAQLAGGGWGEPDVTATAGAIRALAAAGEGSGPEVIAGRSWLAENRPDGSALLPLITALSALGETRRGYRDQNL